MNEDAFDLILIKLRDWLQAADALREEIDTFLNDKARALSKVINKSYDLNKIVWEEDKGARGPFEIAREQENSNNVDYKALLEDLRAHKGRMRHEGYFIWLFKDETAIGRKIKQKTEKKDGLPLHLKE